MDIPAFDLAIFVIATFAGAIVSGLAGFAFGLIVAGIWLHIMPPVAVATVMVGFGLYLQSIGVWKMRHALNFKILWPFLVCGAIGAPIGVAILGIADPMLVRRGVGVLLVVYGLYALARPSFAPFRGAHPALDCVAGFLNGTLGGMTGLTGPIITIWCGLRGWPRDTQRAVFQPVIGAMFVVTAVSLGVSHTMPPQAFSFFLVGLPALALGNWIGLRLYGRLDELRFRRIVLVLLLVSGILLLVA